MKKNDTSLFVKHTKAVIEYVAVKKAKANCLGLMYEPKKPKAIVKK